jgi:hypothetical protein
VTREEKLVEALESIIHARDDRANGAVPPLPNNQSFDDWAADLAQKALDDSLEITIPFALFQTMERKLKGCKEALEL